MLVSMGDSRLNHLIGHNIMMEMFTSISGYDSGSIAHFRPESVERFIYFNQIEHFVLIKTLC